MKHDRCPKCGAPVPASPAPLPPHHCDACLAEAARIINKERKTMPKKENPFDATAAGAPDPDLDKPLTPEEYALYKRLAARVMRTIGKTGAGGRAGGRIGGRARTASAGDLACGRLSNDARASARLDGRRSGVPAGGDASDGSKHL